MKLDAEDLRARIKKLIVERLMIEGLDPNEIADDAPLMDEYGLDSIDALELVLGLEQEFEVKIVAKGMDREAFQTVDSLAEFVETKRAEAEAEAAG